MKNNRIKYMIISLIIVFVILLTLTSIKVDRGQSNFLEKTIKDFTTFIQKVFYTPIKFIKDEIEIFNEKDDLYKKYTKLKETVNETELYYSKIKELQKEVLDLKATLNLNATLSEYTYLNATVINRNIGYWYDSLTIDKGSKNGVKKGDAVITSKGLIGKVSSVSNFSSVVKLLTTNKLDSKISIKIETNNDYEYGLLIGYDEEDNIYKVEGITNSNKIDIGSLVTTTGLTDYFPSGIPIGTVSRIVKDEYDLNSIVEVIPSVDFKNISIVTVLNRKAS